MKYASPYACLVALVACGGGQPSPRGGGGGAVAPAPDAGAVSVDEPPPPEDPFLWLEDVDGDRSLAWVHEQNAISTPELEAVPGFTAMRDRMRTILDAEDRIPDVKKQGKYLYNHWKDADHPRGVWRRTTLAEYEKKQPKWEVLIDVDQLGRDEGVSWVWGGSECLYPDYERCLVLLSRGGSDADVMREFDVGKRAFVDGGFTLPEAKSTVAWKDLDTIYVGTDFGPGSMTTSGYPRIVKEWKRGTPLDAATTIFEGETTDVSVWAEREWHGGKTRDLVHRNPAFFQGRDFVWSDGAFVEVDKPLDADLTFWGDQLLLQLRSDWTVGGATYPAGSLVAADAKAYLSGDRTLHALFTPTAASALANVVPLETVVLVQDLTDVRDGLTAWSRSKQGAWTSKRVTTPPDVSFKVSAFDPDRGDDYWLQHEGFLTPTTLELQRGKGKRKVIKRVPARFDAKGLVVTQHFVTSKDGTRVPYFQFGPKDLPLDGSTPTVIHGYGGFEVSLTPEYKAEIGVGWLERGGVWIVPNLRGGGEYGPAWHQAALTRDRQRAYDDFAAIAEDLIARKVTRPDKLGIRGRSNGGLLVGVMLTQRPELFGAVVCGVPLLDMKRYHLLLAGASWMAEYGNPDDVGDWAALAAYSPYQNVKPDVKYPRALFWTSTRDDRVHPGHARKMAARMRAQGHDLLYWENLEGGHAGSADAAQKSYADALQFAFLQQQLGLAAAP